MSIRFKSKMDGKIFDSGLCERNLNLLAHAQSIELEIGSRCGGFGECGGDRIRIDVADTSRFSPITEAEREHLSAEELSRGFRLACQCFPQSNEFSAVIEFDIKA
jgi:ferredoxin